MGLRRAASSFAGRRCHDLFFASRLFTTAKKGLRRHLHGLRQQERARPGGRPLPELVPARVGEDGRSIFFFPRALFTASTSAVPVQLQLTLAPADGSSGSPQPAADAQPGVSLARAAQRKRRHTYPELLGARRCRLVVFGIEASGPWSEEAATFPRFTAQARAASARAAVRGAGQAAWVQRWSGILSVAAQRAFATSLLEFPSRAFVSER